MTKKLPEIERLKTPPLLAKGWTVVEGRDAIAEFKCKLHRSFRLDEPGRDYRRR